jgi:ADP-ribose pyrophosphatase YjhB (NUDIX family)
MPHPAVRKIKYVAIIIITASMTYFFTTQQIKVESDMPKLTAAGVVHICPENKIALIERGKPPGGIAMFGGHVGPKESPEAAFRRELFEELSISKIDKLKLIGINGDFGRDPRQHSVAVTYSCVTSQQPRAGSDAKDAYVYSAEEILDLLKQNPKSFAFDHGKILRKYLTNLKENPCSE